MSRKPSATDFVVTVPDVGRFTFAKRTMRDEIAIQVKYAEMIDGVTPTDWLVTVCGMLAALSVLTVSAPEDWDIEEFDPGDSETYRKLGLVFNALSAKEDDFRRSKSEAGKASGAGAV